jgi:squalene-hopene/tetraprenyl-beta-curcumene cyclase
MISAPNQNDVVTNDDLSHVIKKGAQALINLQSQDGHWIFPLEADVTIPAEYILYLHYLDERNVDLEKKIAIYLRAKQNPDGGWSLFHEGDFDMSASVKAYFALKAVGDSIDSPHMIRARDLILSRGGAAYSNVFTRNLLALWGLIPWRAVPVMPMEIMHLPQWFFFHLSKVSYWSRTVIVPLLVLNSLKARSRNPLNLTLDELFIVPPDQVTEWNHEPIRSIWAYIFRGLDKILLYCQNYFPKKTRQTAIDKAVRFVDERLNGDDGLGAIFPAMVNAVLMYDILGISKNDSRVLTAKKAIDRLVVVDNQSAWVQPCLSPVWDTSLVFHALQEVNDPLHYPSLFKAAEWLVDCQIRDFQGDWLVRRPQLQRGGGWAFQYANPHYPDVDDSAVVLAALDRLDREKYRETIQLGIDWLIGMQSQEGGWGAFEPENTHYALNHIPFADHGALLDPPTVDVSARCLSALCQWRKNQNLPIAVERSIQMALQYILDNQEDDGSWFGRWGTNYIYGTWSALCALNAVSLPPSHPSIVKAISWLLSKQREDGGWGEDGRSYWEGQPHGEAKESTASHTSWALLALMAAGEGRTESVAKGVKWLMDQQNSQSLWQEKLYNAVGFPRIFYLHYHGYASYFSLWALARYHHLRQTHFSSIDVGL